MNQFNQQNFIPQLSIDCVIFGYKEKELKVLVSQLNTTNPIWALPGGFIRQEESIDTAALRILEERTALKNIYLEQFQVFGQEKRVNKDVFERLNEINNGMDASVNVEWFKQRFVSIGYYALVDISKVTPQKTELDTSIEWLNCDTLPPMIMDHNLIVACALEHLRLMIDHKLIGFNLLPETFTMKEVQELYEAIYDKPFARNNFQKKILDLDVLERLEKKFTGAANKAPYLYRFKK